MYLRTTKRANKDGSVVEYLHLAHNERHPDTNTPTARIIHNFGRADEVDRQDLVRLCRSIARVCDLTIHDPLEAAARLPLAAVGLPEGVKLLETVELGAPLVLEAIWERLGIGRLLRGIAKDRRCRVLHERALFAMVANRLCEPDSKLGVWDRWLEKVYLPSCQALKRPQMYEAMDFLHEHIDEVERAVFAQTSNLFNLDVDVIFYDTTSASFFIDEEDEDLEGEPGLRKFGHSKEGGWSPQVVVALAVTRDGLPVRSWVFPGNTADVTTVQRVRADLRDWNLGRAMFVGDAAMNSVDNREELARACGKYLLAAKMATVKEVRDEVLSRPGRYAELEENLRIKEVVLGDGVNQRRYIVCHNPFEEDRQRKHRAKVLEELAEELSRHKDDRATKQWAIELKASGRYGRYLKIVDGKLRIDLARARDAERYDGKWVIQTNDDTLSAEDAAYGYKGLMVIERCFRSLKRTQIKMTPMYHWRPHRIETHVKLCVLALLLERVIERTTKQPWARVRELLGKLQVSRFETERHQFFQRNEPPAALAGLLRTLAIPFPERILGIAPLSDA